MKAYMITIEGREETADSTAKAFEDAGLEVVRMVQPEGDPVGQVGNHANSQRVLDAAMEDGEDFLFIEDDLFTNHERLLRAIQAVQDDPELTYLYIHESAYHMQGIYPLEDSRGVMSKLHQYFNFRRSSWREDSKGIVMREGLRTLLHHRVYGSQCVFIPARYLEWLSETHNEEHEYSPTIRAKYEQPFDNTIIETVGKYKIPIRTYLPHPVQHLQNRTLRGFSRSDVYSRTFHTTSDIESQLASTASE